MVDRFRRHPDARLFWPDGTEHRDTPAPASVIDARLGPAAVLQAISASARSLPFRIGATDLPQPDADPDDVPAFETLTSGSTGAPRRIRRTHASWIASFLVNAGGFGLGPGVAVAVPGRLDQSLALYGALEAMHLGATLHLLDGLRPDRMPGAIAARAADVLYATPAQLRQLPDAGGPEVPRLRLILSGGSKLDPATRTALRRQFPAAEVREFYGAAETSFISLADRDAPPGSVGRAYPGVEIDLRGAAGAGLIWVRSPYLFRGYAGHPGTAVRDGDWLSVGEIGRIDNGFLHIEGRSDRMLTVADRNVFPEEIEGFLLTLPGVRQAAVLARPDRLRGHVLEAVVRGGEAAAVLARCRAELGPLKSPRRIHLVDDWPVLPSGKTDLSALQRLIG